MILNKLNSKDKTLKIIYDKYYKGLVCYGLTYTHRLDISEDIVQEVIVNFYINNREECVKGNVLSYLRGAVIKASLKHNRDNNKFIFEEIEEKINFDIFSSTDEEDNEIMINRLMLLIDKLPRRSKEIFKLIMFENKKIKQVASELSISENSVKSQYYNSIDRIKELIKKTYLIFL